MNDENSCLRNNLNANGVGRVSNIVRRILVEKPGFDIEAQHLLQDLKENLGLTALTRVRIINRYDMEGVTADNNSRRGI